MDMNKVRVLAAYPTCISRQWREGDWVVLIGEAAAMPMGRGPTEADAWLSAVKWMEDNNVKTSDRSTISAKADHQLVATKKDGAMVVRSHSGGGWMKIRTTEGDEVSVAFDIVHEDDEHNVTVLYTGMDVRLYIGETAEPKNFNIQHLGEGTALLYALAELLNYDVVPKAR